MSGRRFCGYAKSSKLYFQFQSISPQPHLQSATYQTVSPVKQVINNLLFNIRIGYAKHKIINWNMPNNIILYNSPLDYATMFHYRMGSKLWVQSLCSSKTKVSYNKTPVKEWWRSYCTHLFPSMLEKWRIKTLARLGLPL